MKNVDKMLAEAQALGTVHAHLHETGDPWHRYSPRELALDVGAATWTYGTIAYPIDTPNDLGLRLVAAYEEAFRSASPARVQRLSETCEICDKPLYGMMRVHHHNRGPLDEPRVVR